MRRRAGRHPVAMDAGGGTPENASTARRRERAGGRWRRRMCNRFQVGDLDVLVVSDGEISFPAHAYFPASSEELWKAHDRWRNHDGTLTFPYSCFLVRSGERRV